MSPASWFSNRKAAKWFALTVIAAAFYLSQSKICIRQLTDVTPGWLVFAWLFCFVWLFLLIRFKSFSGPHRISSLIGTIVGLNLLAQSTGGEQSPLIFAVFLLMGIAAWEGDAKYGFWVAILFSLFETVYLRTENVPQGLFLYLRWAAFLTTAFFLQKVVKTRKEKERLDHHLESLKNEAVQLASDAEPSSFNIPKDKLLKEEGRLSARLGTVMELEDSLTRQLTLFQKSLPVHTAVFFLLTTVEEKTVLRLRAFSSESDSVASDVTILPGETLIGLAAKEGKKVLLNQIPPESAKALPYYLKPNPVASFACYPVYLKNNSADPIPGEDSELVGVLVLDHLKPDFFQDPQINLIDQFGRLLADTIHSARILHFSRTKTRNLHALYEVSHSFSTLLEINRVLETVLKTAKEISPCDSAYVALAEGDGKTFNARAWLKSPKTAEKPERLEEELAAWVLENKKPIRYTRGQKDKSLAAFSRKEGMLGSVQSFILVPLLVGENVLGVIRLNSQHPDTYQEYDQDVLTTLANQTAMALENALMVQQIRDMATKDGLTGVFNHRYFQEKLEEEITKADRYNKDLSLALLDVDHFKKFNDNFGHQEGDRVLRTVSEIIQTTIRSKIDTVARYGGEEFAIILPEADGNVGKELAERIRKNIESHLFEKDGKSLYRVNVSIGISSYPFDSRDQKVLIQLADRALYEAKAGGRNCVRRFKTGTG